MDLVRYLNDPGRIGSFHDFQVKLHHGAMEISASTSWGPFTPTARIVARLEVGEGGTTLLLVPDEVNASLRQFPMTRCATVLAGPLKGPS